MTSTPSAPDPLVKFGFSQDEAAALRVLWGSRHIASFLDAVPDLIHGFGGTVEDALDFITHAIEEPATGLFFHQGFTAHQAALIQADPTAISNLYDRHAAGVADLLDSDVPRDFIVNVLRAAKSPDEVDRFLHRYEQATAGTPVVTDHGPDTVGGLSAEVAMLAGLQPIPEFPCGCP